jgi:tetratricopeptide (TPR) repeat protein
MLCGRRHECSVLAGLFDAAREGRSGVLVLRGEAGVGKTALLESASASAPDLEIARAAGVESEIQLPFAALHQLCGPMLDRLDRLPAPQRDALATTFGLSAGAMPARLVVGLAVLGLLSDVAEDRPLVCVVDDAHWLDRASAQVLAFVARRLFAESVVMLISARRPGEEFHGLPELALQGLAHPDARQLLRSVVPGPLDERVREQIIAETRGNPLALLELPRGLTPAQMAGGFGLPGALSLHGRIEANFLRRISSLPDDTRRLLVVAAAEPTGDPALLWLAAERLGLTGASLEPAQHAGLLLETGRRVRFRHPLVRSAIYRAASAGERQTAHHLLAAVTDQQLDPDRHAWHCAQAATGPDEQVAAELERSAGRARGRGGLAAAAAFLEQAVWLTPDPRRRAARALAAAEAQQQAGSPEAAMQSLVTAEEGPLNEAERARADLVRGEIAYAQNRGSEAPALLLRAAKRLEPLDIELARATYLDALAAASFAGTSSRGVRLAEVLGCARAACRASSRFATGARRVRAPRARHVGPRRPGSARGVPRRAGPHPPGSAQRFAASGRTGGRRAPPRACEPAR